MLIEDVKPFVMCKISSSYQLIYFGVVKIVAIVILVGLKQQAPKTQTTRTKKRKNYLMINA